MNSQSLKNAPRPSNGRIMDFAPRQTVHRQTPRMVIEMPTRQTARPVAPKQPTQAQFVRATRTTVTRPVVAPAPSQPAAKPVRPVSAPTRPAVARPVAQPQPRPVAQPQPRPVSAQPTQPQPVATITTIEEEVDFGVIEDFGPVAEPQQSTPPPIGTKSPFFNSVIVPKRPLSSSVPNHSEHRLHNAKNAKQEPETKTKAKLAPTSVIKPASRKSKTPLILLVAGTVIVGAVVGACAYFFIFQGQ